MRIAFKQPSQQMPLFCESIGYQWQQPPIKRPKGYYVFHWLQTEAGTGIVTVNDHSITLGPNQGILIRAGVAHDYQSSSPHKTWQTAFLAFGGDQAEALMAFLGLHDYRFFPSLFPELATFINQTYAEFQKSDIIATLRQSSELYRFIMLLKQADDYVTNGYQTEQIVAPILTYISKHFDTAITNQQLAALTGYSVAYQNRVFKSSYGQTPLKYLTDYRLQRAKMLLTIHPDWQIQRVGNSVGFNDISRFIHEFKRYYRLTPNQFRKLM